MWLKISKSLRIANLPLILLLGFPRELWGQKLELKPPHFTVFHHLHDFAWVQSQAIPFKIQLIRGRPTGVLLVGMGIKALAILRTANLNRKFINSCKKKECNSIQFCICSNIYAQNTSVCLKCYQKSENFEI